MPKVSVIMPLYNSKKYVKDAIESILNQTYKDLEIIAINDGSKDGCADIVRGIKDDRLVFIDSEDNHGFVYTLNWCMSLAKGEYIARLDDDDIAYPTRIEKQVRFMEEHPEVSISGTGMNILIDGETRTDSFVPILGSKQIKFSLPFSNMAFAHSSFIMRKSIIDKYDIEYEIFKQCPDYHMICVMSQYGEVDRIEEPLVGYRIHSAQSTAVRSLDMQINESDGVKKMHIEALKDIPEYVKHGIRLGTFRKIYKHSDYNDFMKGFTQYAYICGLNRDDESDREAIDYIYRYVMTTQFHTPALLFEIIKDGKIKLFVNKVYWKFIISCLISRNIGFIESKI